MLKADTGAENLNKYRRNLFSRLLQVFVVLLSCSSTKDYEA